MTAETALILTHGDVDGMVSAILLLQRLPAGTPIRITNGENLAWELEALGRDAAIPAALFLADLPLVTKTAGRVRAAITTLTRFGPALHIYDHHRGWDTPEGRAIRQLCQTFIVKPRDTTAAAIIWADFLDRERKPQRWLQLIAQRERATDREVRRDFGAIAALQQPQHWRHQDEVLHGLADGTSTLTLVEELATWYYDIHRPRERKIASRADVLVTKRGRRIAWLDLRAEDGRLMVVRDAIEQHHVELVVTVIAKGVMVNGPAIDQGVDMTSLHNEHVVGEVKFVVVGHKSPVRVSPMDGDVDGAFVAAARDFVLARL